MNSPILILTILIFSLIFLNISMANSSTILLEAEDATLQGVAVADSQSGFSGTGYVTGFYNAGDRTEFNFEAETGLYEISIGFATPENNKGYDLIVNGSKSTGLFPATNGQFREHRAGKYQLTDTQNTVIIGKGWGWFNIDYIKLIPATIQQPPKPPVKLSDNQANSATKSLFSFLIDLYGTKVLSGQQSMDDIKYVLAVTGKLPAVGAFDLMDYSPSRLIFGANPKGSVESWIDWAINGNSLISLSWHWNAPTDLINKSGGQEWYRGFYTRATTFDIAATLADTGSERYHLLIRDLDAIALELKKFQEKDIPFLWRPLHEASGGWFWWGAKGPEPFIALWKLMYQRYTRYHGLHNLIWVYTNGHPDWYPGDDVVDIVALDVYTDQSSNMSGEWENVQQEFNGRKLVALAESGTIPVPENIRTYATWWSWFSIWNGNFIRNMDQELLKAVYADDAIITLDELPDWRKHGTGKRK
jgi:mannan endo-1,4-beta-mannosidase